MSDKPETMLYDDPDIEDVDVLLDEEDFDFAAFVEGIRPARKRVRLYPNGHLLADVEALIERADAAADDDEAEALAEKAQALAERMKQSVVMIVEARSSERLQAIEKQAYADGVPDPQKIAQRIAQADNGKKPLHESKREGLLQEAARGTREVMLRQLADQVVHPSTVTVDGLKALGENAEAELDRLWRAAQAVRTQSAGSVSPDFSRGRSGSRPAG